MVHAYLICTTKEQIKKRTVGYIPECAGVLLYNGKSHTAVRAACLWRGYTLTVNLYGGFGRGA